MPVEPAFFLFECTEIEAHNIVPRKLIPVMPVRNAYNFAGNGEYSAQADVHR